MSCKPGTTESTADASITTDYDVRAPTAPVITDDGRTIVFGSLESLVPQDTNGQKDIYEYRRSAPLADQQRRPRTSMSLLIGMSRRRAETSSSRRAPR